MSSFTDYYTLLGVDIDAPSPVIKAAFKRLALQYHPDVYKGQDAHERMRVLLQAYQTLSDPQARRQYDARRSEFIRDGRTSFATTDVMRSSDRAGEVSPGAKRDRQRHYAFPVFHEGQPMQLRLGAMDYSLSAERAHLLVSLGMLRGTLAETRQHLCYCHRCHHSWKPVFALDRDGRKNLPRACPRCRAIDWSEYLLLRCIHCQAVFESEQIRYGIAAPVHNGRGKSDPQDDLCPPYELFPLCPCCGVARWCPAEEQRVEELQQQAKRKNLFRWLGG